ncbi:MAG TPA: hypothetical protein VNG69_14165 [Casimicrobiaceae bacterium]|nr:hypothetical protein [Casimicrobiaceae bacterium]
MLAFACLALTAQGEALIVGAGCREGQVHGEWKLGAPDGSARAIGAFAKGKRTGSFIFWSPRGIRIAHVPYEDGLKNGTLALWHERGAPDGASAQWLEAPYAHGAINGIKRSWYRDGKLRSEDRYAAGQLIEAKAWDERGRPLPDDAARQRARADFDAEQALYLRLDKLIEANLPHCPPNGPARPQ